VSLSKKVVTTYAKSLFQNVKSASSNATAFDLTNVSIPMSADQAKSFVPDINVIGEELILLSSTVSSSTKLKTFFNNPTYAESQKLEVLLTIFPGLTLTTKSFLKVLTERSHLNLLPEIQQEYVKLLNGFNGTCAVKLVTASTLKETYGATLLTALKKLTAANNIILNVSYNPKLLGGLILEYKSSSIDASILKEFSLFFNEV
jgi:ATP synthase F1 delta subunit|tara:strand:- start:196 stop:804 length:609 start_codon:yes stop_codon:yes gene_type:complete